MENADSPELPSRADPTLRIDLSWLLMVAEHKMPGDPQVTDWGALVAAVSRHQAEIFGTPVYSDPYTRAAALLQSLLHVPPWSGPTPCTPRPSRTAISSRAV